MYLWAKHDWWLRKLSYRSDSLGLGTVDEKQSFRWSGRCGGLSISLPSALCTLPSYKEAHLPFESFWVVLLISQHWQGWNRCLTRPLQAWSRVIFAATYAKLYIMPASKTCFVQSITELLFHTENDQKSILNPLDICPCLTFQLDLSRLGSPSSFAAGQASLRQREARLKSPGSLMPEVKIPGKYGRWRTSWSQSQKDVVCPNMQINQNSSSQFCSLDIYAVVKKTFYFGMVIGTLWLQMRPYCHIGLMMLMIISESNATSGPQVLTTQRASGSL